MENVFNLKIVHLFKEWLRLFQSSVLFSEFLSLWQVIMFELLSFCRVPLGHEEHTHTHTDTLISHSLIQNSD